MREGNSIWDKQQSTLGLKSSICSTHGKRLTPFLQYNCVLVLVKTELFLF